MNSFQAQFLSALGSIAASNKMSSKTLGTPSAPKPKESEYKIPSAKSYDKALSDYDMTYNKASGGATGKIRSMANLENRWRALRVVSAQKQLARGECKYFVGEQ